MFPFKKKKENKNYSESERQLIKDNLYHHLRMELFTELQCYPEALQTEIIMNISMNFFCNAILTYEKISNKPRLNATAWMFNAIEQMLNERDEVKH